MSTRPGRITGSSVQVSVRVPRALHDTLAARGPVGPQLVAAAAREITRPAAEGVPRPAEPPQPLAASPAAPSPVSRRRSDHVSGASLVAAYTAQLEHAVPSVRALARMRLVALGALPPAQEDAAPQAARIGTGAEQA